MRTNCVPLVADLFCFLFCFFFFFFCFFFVFVFFFLSGLRVKLVGRKSALKPPVLYSTDRSKAVVPVLVLSFVALWFILRGDLFYLVLFCSCIF